MVSVVGLYLVVSVVGLYLVVSVVGGRPIPSG